MAFNPERLSLLVQPIGENGLRFYSYQTDDAEATVTGAGYVTNASDYGLRAYDLIFISPLDASVEPYILAVDTIDADGHATLASPGPIGDLLAVNNLSDLASAATARTNLGLGSAAVLDSGTASGNLKTLNAVGGFTFDSTSTPAVNWSGPFGGTWVGLHRLASDDAVDQPATGAYGTLILKRVVDGTGTNGPGNASLALMISSELASWLTNTGVREVDAVTIALRSGINGDASSVLLNGKKVYDAGAAYGMTGVEGALYWTNATEVTRLGVKVTLGGLINASDVRGGGFGVKLGALIGDASLGSLSPATALLVTGDTGNWQNILVATANGVATTDEFMVLRGAGGTRNQPEIHLGPRTGRIVQRYASNVFSLNWSTDGGTTLSEVFRVTSTGAGRFTTADDSGSAAPSVDLYRNSASPLAGDIMGQLRFVGMDSGAAEEVYAQIRSVIVDPTATSEGADLDLMTVSAGTLGVRLKVRAGLYHPSATGGDKGNNTLNFGAVYDDNVLLTDYVFDLWSGREVTGSERIIAKANAFDVSMFDQKKYGDFFKAHGRLWGMPDLNDHIDGVVKEHSLGGMVQLLWQTAELNAIHVDNLADRVSAIEAHLFN